MTTKLEQEFFEAMGIEAKTKFARCKNGIDYYAEECIEETCKGCNNAITRIVYPPITDTIVLMLENILFKNRFGRVASLKTNNSLGGTFVYNWYLGGAKSTHFYSNENSRKDSILSLFIKMLKNEYVYIRPTNKVYLTQLKGEIREEVQELFT